MIRGVPVTRSAPARSPGVTRSATATALSALVLISVVACGPVDTGRSTGAVVQRTGEEFASGRAVLSDGPYRRTGLDALGNNVIGVWRGEYHLFTESEPAHVIVEYVDRPIELPAWDRITCEQLSVLVAAQGEATVYARTEGDGRTFFFTFSPTVDAPCRFVARFLSEFEFFRGAVEADSIPPFPAILDVS